MLSGAGNKVAVNIIGGGKLGKVVGHLLHHSPVAYVRAVLNTSQKTANEAANLIGKDVMPCVSIADLPPARVSFITTNDGAIESVCDAVVTKHSPLKDALIAHCSGSLSAKVLASAKAKGFLTASIHPIKSFANFEACIKEFKGTVCAFEGDNDAKQTLDTLFSSIGGEVITINSDKKRTYHAAGVIANNYMVTLHSLAVQCYMDAGMDESTAKRVVSMLMGDASRNLNMLSHAASLTGPIQRGDAKTVAGHMEALREAPKIRQVYSVLGFSTLPLTRHNPQVTQALERALDISDNNKDAEPKTTQKGPHKTFS